MCKLDEPPTKYNPPPNSKLPYNIKPPTWVLEILPKYRVPLSIVEKLDRNWQIHSEGKKARANCLKLLSRLKKSLKILHTEIRLRRNGVSVLLCRCEAPKFFRSLKTPSKFSLFFTQMQSSPQINPPPARGLWKFDRNIKPGGFIFVRGVNRIFPLSFRPD